jgi:hypothetical protein
MTADAALRAGDASGPALAATTRDRRLRIVLGLARAEAPLLFRSVFVLAALLGGGVLVWNLTKSAEPLWWNAAWQIGEGQAVLAAGVLIAAHLAAGRARRDGLRELYESLPVGAATRTTAHLASLIGAVAVSVLFIGAAAVWVQIRGGVGTPSAAVLIGGVLLVVAAGAAGIALGTRLPHPLAGVLAAVVLFALFSESYRFPGAFPWLFPWTISDQFGSLYAPLTGYPPGGAHALELAGIAIGLAAIAIALTSDRGRHRMWLAVAGALSVALIGAGVAGQLTPVPSTDLNRLFRAVASPSQVQHCTSARDVSYCLYPGFGGELSALQAPINEVLKRLPARPAHALTVAQAMSVSLNDPPLTHGHTRQQLARWNADLQKAPINAAAASAIYLTVGSWPAGAGLAGARFALALGTAEWAVHLPPTALGVNSSGQACVPDDQAREAIAIWLAITTTHAPASLLMQDTRITRFGGPTVAVPGQMIYQWIYPGEYEAYVSSGPQLTYNGYLLASKMVDLPPAKVARVLDGEWSTWLNWRTTDAQLASALGIQAPNINVPPPPTNPRPGVRTANPSGPIPIARVCTS